MTKWVDNIERVLATRLIRGSCDPPIIVMQPPENRGCNDFPSDLGRRFDTFGAGDPLAEPLMQPRLVEVLERILLEHATKVRLVQDDDVIEALSPGTAKKPLANRVQIWRPGRDSDDFDTRALGDRGKLLSELPIVVPDQEPRALAERCRLAKLLRCPPISRRPSHTDVHDFPRAVPDDEEGEDRPKEPIVELQEIAGPDFVGVVLEKSPPRLAAQRNGARTRAGLLPEPAMWLASTAPSPRAQLATSPFMMPA